MVAIGSWLASPPPPLPLVLGSHCETSLGEDELVAIRERAQQLLEPALRESLGSLPIDQRPLARLLADRLITQKRFCTALAPQHQATEHNHNEWRHRFRGQPATRSNAAGYGVIATRFSVISGEQFCPADYDWRKHPDFIGVASCQGALNAIHGETLPVAMYIAKGVDIQSRFADVSQLRHYLYFYEDNAIGCMTDGGESATFYPLEVPLRNLPDPNVPIVLHGVHRDGYSVAQLRSQCRVGDEEYETSNLMMDFVFRVYIHLQVDTDGRREDWTLIIGSAVAIPQPGLAADIAKKWGDPFERFIGGTIATKLFLDAAVKGWTLK